MSALDIRSDDCQLDFLSLGAMVHRLDRSYSDFVTEQLAGDELVRWPDTTLRPEIIESLTATGFLRMASDGTASSGIDVELARNQVIDRLDVSPVNEILRGSAHHASLDTCNC